MSVALNGTYKNKHQVIIFIMKIAYKIKQLQQLNLPYTDCMGDYFLLSCQLPFQNNNYLGRLLLFRESGRQNNK